MRLRILALSLAVLATPILAGDAVAMRRRCDPFIQSDPGAPMAPAALPPFAAVADPHRVAGSFDPATRWEPLTPDPIGFQGSAMIIDPVRHRLVAFGGEGVVGNTNNVYVRSLDPSGSWTLL